MNRIMLLALTSLFCLCRLCVAQGAPVGDSTRAKEVSKAEYGIASFYHNKFVGRHTANGEIFSQEKLTAAHNRLPMGTWIEVTNLRNNKSVIVRVNDRMHRNNPRVVDLSTAAAKKLGIRGDSLIRVKVSVVKKKKTNKRREQE